MSAALDTLHLMGICLFFLSSNFVPFVLPILFVDAVYYDNFWCRAVLVLVVVEYTFPLHPGPRAYWPLFSNLASIHKGLESYNQAEIIVEGKYDDKNKNYCVCYFPHSLYGIGLFTIRKYFYDTYGTHILFSGADIIFYVPILRRIMSWWGCTKVSKTALKKTLKLPYPHNALMLQPDGIAGMFHGTHDHEQIYLQRRKGFCRIALQTGASLVPCYILGANQLYNRAFGPESLAYHWSHRLRTSLVFWTGRFGVPFGFIPNNNKLVIVLGKAIHVERVENPTQEQIEALHGQFVKEIKALYDRHKHRMGKEWATSRSRLYLETEKLPGSPGEKMD